jgi:two-component system, sensor histidine kinase and response regulator
MQSDRALIRPKVLYVDDEEENLLIFRRGFREHLDIATAASGQAGLELIEHEEFAVVLSDQRMPQMTGTEFLREVRIRRPESVAIIVTAYSNFDDAVRAINEGSILRYVTKPWKRPEMLLAILEAAALFERRRENRLLSETLVRQEEEAALSQLTSGLVHELANIAGVLTTVEDLKEDWDSDDPLDEELASVKKAIERYRRLVDSLRLCARGEEGLALRLAHCDLVEVIRDAVELASTFAAVRALHRLEIRAGEPYRAEVDAAALSQVLLNLIKNAAESCSHLPRAEVMLALHRDPSGSIEIRVEDSGPGVPAEIGERIFGGFYSTKGAAGTGLGLATSRRIVEAHGGRLSFQNHEAGCTFTVRLPERPPPSSGA